MSVFDFFRRKKPTGMNYAPTMSGTSPIFTSFGNSIYASDIVVQSIRCKANEFKKLTPRHVRYTDGVQEVVGESSIARVLKRPNPYMSTADFLEKITILLELNKNVYILPEWRKDKDGGRIYEALYPLRPAEVTYLVDESGTYFINFVFPSGVTTTVKASEIIHWRKDYGVNDYFGGNALGTDADTGLLAMLKRYDLLTQSIAKALEVSCKVNGIVKYNTYISGEKQDAEMADFKKRVESNESGILFTDSSTEYTHIPHDVKLVDKDTLNFFYETILRANGTSLAILNGDYTKAQKEAYYEHALEADIKSLGQAFTRCVFTDREISFGNEVIFFPHEINFMSMENKIAALQIGLPAGLFTKDEAREMLGYAPLPDGQGQAVPQGYNNLLDTQNNNTLNGGNDTDGTEEQAE